MRNLIFVWNIMPEGQNWASVRVYEVAGAVYTLIATAAMPATSITVNNIPAGAHSYVVRSYDGTQESADSNIVNVPAQPLAPTLTVTIVTS